MNPWVINRSKDLYGRDADEWRPERWLEYTPEYLKYLGWQTTILLLLIKHSDIWTETYNTNWGTGGRSCPGRHLAQAMYYKIIPSIFLNFEWEFADPKAERISRTTFTVRFHKLMMKWKRRTPAVWLGSIAFCLMRPVEKFRDVRIEPHFRVLKTEF